MAKGSAKFDRRIGFERFASDARNSLNELVGSWVLLGQTMASRVDVRDSEKKAAGREASALVARFEVRSTAVTRSLSPADRLVLSGQWNESGALLSGDVWDIEAVKEVSGVTNLAIEITAVKNREDQI